MSDKSTVAEERISLLVEQIQDLKAALNEKDDLQVILLEFYFHAAIICAHTRKNLNFAAVSTGHSSYQYSCFET